MKIILIKISVCSTARFKYNYNRTILDVQRLTYLFNILTLNPVHQKIFIFTKEPEAKYNFLLKNFLKM